MTCKKCGREITSFTQRCPNCGTLVENTMSSTGKSKRSKVVLLGSIFLMGIIGLFWYSSNYDKAWYEKTGLDAKKDSNAWKDEDYSGLAYIRLEEIVRDRLKSPTTAKFPSDGYRNHVTDLGNLTYQISSYVDSQNSFGAMIRTHFTGRIRREENRWALISLEFE